MRGGGRLGFEGEVGIADLGGAGRVSQARVESVKITRGLEWRQQVNVGYKKGDGRRAIKTSSRLQPPIRRILGSMSTTKMVLLIKDINSAHEGAQSFLIASAQLKPCFASPSRYPAAAPFGTCHLYRCCWGAGASGSEVADDGEGAG